MEHRYLITCGLLFGGGVLLIQVLEHQLISHHLTLEAFVALVAALFTGLGIWVSRQWTMPRPATVVPPPEATEAISKREWEVLRLMAEGLSNREIAEKLFVSTNTVKTHTAGLYRKLAVTRRTQAVRRAREWRLLP